MISLIALTAFATVFAAQLMSATPISSASTNAPPVQVHVYYESRCSDSEAFINQQLYSDANLSVSTPYERLIYSILGDSVLNITFVPFGKAVTITTKWNNRTDYVCQHGVAECLGNNMQACFLLQNPNLSQNITVSYINCLMTFSKLVSEVNREYGEKYGINWQQVEQCANDQHVYPTYVDAFDKATHAVQAEVKAVPFVTIDGGAANDSDAIEDFLSAVCSAYRGNKPVACIKM